MWHIYLWVMRVLPIRFLQRGLWWLLRKVGIAGRLCDEGFLKLQLLGVTGEFYSLRHGGVNSYILWQRLNFKDEILRKGCDKYAVREIVRERIGEEWLVPLIKIGDKDCWTNPDELNLDDLPNSFVVKLTNGSGMNLLVKDKSNVNWEEAKKLMRRWLASDYSLNSREYQYQGVENKLIIEQMLFSPSGDPEDYKVMCSNGKPLYLWVDTNRFSDHRRNVFTLDWKDNGVTIAYKRTDKVIPEPKNLQVMLELAGKMSRGIPIVRIDFYNVLGRIYFGEMTFTSDCGLAITTPFSFSRDMAAKIEI